MSPNNLILGGGGILFSKFQTFDEDDEQDSDSLAVFTTFLPGIRIMNLSQVTETGGHRNDSSKSQYQRRRFNGKNSGKTKIMLIPAPKRNPPRLIWG